MRTTIDGKHSLTLPYRDPDKTLETLDQEGVDMFYHTYGESAEAIRELSRERNQEFASVYESVLGWTWSRIGHP
jgi:hypothetical protein